MLVNEKTAKVTITLILSIAIVGVFFLQPIAQDPQYHLFIDQRSIIYIQNFWNVISNLPFLIVGLMGIYSIAGAKKMIIIAELQLAYLTFFIGVTLVAFGSGYYHLWPTNHSLVWDRLPMTIAFMALFAIVIAEFISKKLAQYLLWPLIIIGAFSVLYWSHTESLGRGDLRFYVLVQLLPIITIPLSLLLFKPTFTTTSGYWLLLASYICAKLLELYDDAIYATFSIISGHSLKHIIAALGVLLLLRAFNNRTAIEY